MVDWNGHEVTSVGPWELMRVMNDRVVWDYRGSGQIIVAVGRDQYEDGKWKVKTGQPPLINGKMVVEGVDQETAIEEAEEYMRENDRPKVLGTSRCPFEKDD